MPQAPTLISIAKDEEKLRLRKLGFALAKPKPEKPPQNLTGLWEADVGRGTWVTLRINHAGFHLRGWWSEVSFPAPKSPTQSRIQRGDFENSARRSVVRIVGLQSDRAPDGDEKKSSGPQVYRIDELTDEAKGSTKAFGTLTIKSKKVLRLERSGRTYVFERVHDQPTLSSALLATVSDSRARDLLTRNEWTPLVRAQRGALEQRLRDLFARVDETNPAVAHFQLGWLDHFFEDVAPEDRVLAIDWLTRTAWSRPEVQRKVGSRLFEFLEKGNDAARILAGLGFDTSASACFEYRLEVLEGEAGGGAWSKEVSELVKKKFGDLDELQAKIRKFKRVFALKVGVGWHATAGIALLEKFRVEGSKKERVFREAYFLWMGGLSAGVGIESDGASYLLDGLPSVGVGRAEFTSGATLLDLGPKDVVGGALRISSSMSASFLVKGEVSASIMVLYGASGGPRVGLHAEQMTSFALSSSVGAEVSLLKYMAGYLHEDIPDSKKLSDPKPKVLPVGDEITAGLKDKVHFRFNDASLTELGMSYVRAIVAEHLAAFLSDGAAIEVVGHADRPGPTHINGAISMARALNVAQAISDLLSASFGVSLRESGRLVVVGAGEAHARGSESKKDRQARRVEIFVRGVMVGSLEPVGG
ncbi:MAG: hypothetical protein HC923_08675 [Myxococcales bacterium]|nr:hypothetical protein [Myxococcales bacterium]